MQEKAVLTTEGGVLVLAGAGTGKTKALTSRIAHIITSHLSYPSGILAVTFTNKAAKEMVHRVQRLLGEAGSDHANDTAGMWLGTFHSIAARILRRDGSAIGLDSNFTILDTDDQLRLLKSLMGDAKVDEKRFPPKIMLGMIQSWKDRGLSPAKVNGDLLESDYAKKAHALYEIYQRRLITLNATDFGDLLLHNLTLFQEQPHILQRYAEKFRYILVDEYQDTNVGQYLWLRLLAIAHRNICCVGDDDQSIYGWRGAEVGNILRFEEDFKGAAVIRLEQNYRSTEHILAAASGLIAHNESRHGKTLWTEAKGGNRIRIKSLWDDGEEARYVGEEIESLQRDQTALNDIAILVRAGFQTRAFEERFLTLGIPYRVIGGLRFYERREIRDAIAYLRFVMQPRDDLAFERIINTPKRGVGKTTLEELHTYARVENISLFESATRLQASGRMKGKANSALAALLLQHAAWQEMSTHVPPAELCEYMLEQANYMEMWRLEQTVEANGRLENLKELFRALQDFAHAGEFLEHVSLVMDREANPSDDMVNLMSLHASKGLEFDAVFCSGWEEGLFPHQRSMDEQGTAGLEEERRLAYVGITRAKRLLTITHAANRRIYNQWQSCLPSRFLSEIPEDHVEETEGTDGRSRAAAPSLFQHRMEQVMRESGRMQYMPAPAADSWTGKRIFHSKFGYGQVLEASGNHLDIAFEKAGRKKLMAEYVKLA